MKRALVPTNDAEMQIPISGSWQDLESSKFEFRLRFSMFQQHRVRAKRKRRRAYLQRKKVSLRATRRDPVKPRPKKQSTAAE